jgi:hypothetical protein
MHIYRENAPNIGSLSLVCEAHATLLSPATAAIYIYIYMRATGRANLGSTLCEVIGKLSSTYRYFRSLTIGYASPNASLNATWDVKFSPFLA